MQNPVHETLLRALGKIDRPGTFCAHGVLPAVFPGLTVAGEGPVALPLASQQAESLKIRARQAPYGKGAQTLVDVDVRRVWEIDAEKVSFANPAWEAVVRQAADRVQTELGLEKQKLSAHLYKLLLYEAGSFFLPHRDGEKLERMVGTLVVALPSAHTGGFLVVRHDGREETIDFALESPYEIQFAAFYADCEHEVRPVESGFRLALTYNLTLEKSKERITAPTTSGHIAAVAEVLRAWTSDALPVVLPAGDESSAGKLAVVLDHKYTVAGLSTATLKGLDRAKADALFAAAREAECDAYLALAVYWESGSAEPADGGGYDEYEEYEEDEESGDYAMGEVYDHTLVLKNFRDSAGVAAIFGELPLDESEVVSKKPLDQGAPDREEFEGYTGNAGMTLERWYHRAVVVLWPAAARFDVLCQAGLHTAVGGLAGMVERWKQADAALQPALKAECLAFADRILARWLPREWATSFVVEEPDAPPLLLLLRELGEPSRISAWIRQVLARDASIDSDELLGDLCEDYGWQTFAADLATLFQGTVAATLTRHARFLADWSLRTGGGGRAVVCQTLAGELMTAVEKSPLRKPENPWEKLKVDLPDLLSLLLKSFLGLDRDDLLERLRKYVLERPELFDVTTIQAPMFDSLKAWLVKNVDRARPPLTEWWAALRGILEARAAAPPQPPADERRAADIPCKCQDCAALRRFLEDPQTKTLRLAAATARRAHLHQTVDQHKLDTTHVTQRIGRPYTLVFTKTAARYQAALKAHRVDLEQLERLRGLEAWHDGLSTAAPQPKPSTQPKKKAAPVKKSAEKEAAQAKKDVNKAAPRKRS